MKQGSLLPTAPSLLISPRVPLIHRDLSWLQFNERVLSEAREKSNPLLERLKFLSITASNLDEFFTIRFASLIRSIHRYVRQDNQEGVLQLTRIRSSILKTVIKFNRKQGEIMGQLRGELDEFGIQIVYDSLENEQMFLLGKKVFEQEVFPLLGNPERFESRKIHSLANLQSSVLISDQLWLRIPKSLPSVYSINASPNSRGSRKKTVFFFLNDLIATHLGTHCGLKGILGIVRLTRDGDIEVDFDDEDPESIPDIVRTKIRTRDKGPPIRLQCSPGLPRKWIENFRRVLKLPHDQVFGLNWTACLNGLWSVVSKCPIESRNKSRLVYRPLKPSQLKPFSLDQQKPELLFSALKERDWLLHHPYDSFDNFVDLVRAACNDPKVVSVELTIYRMDAVSPIIEALTCAAKVKKVRVVIEPRARFDELNNLKLADQLTAAGAKVAFGFGKLKLHAKVALFTRKEGRINRLYTHLSTGNYNATTARQYTDLAIITANPIIGQDARILFDSIFRNQLPSSFKVLVPAPEKLHRKMISHIQKEIDAARSGKPASIVAKVNALVDFQLIAQLYKASSEGVKIDLIVRGACALVPGVKGLSENIRVISVIDRFLEHSRIYYFKNSHVIYLSSADWMQRNFFSRFEIAFPVLDPEIYKYLEEVVIPTYVRDTEKAWELTPRGSWIKRSALEGKSAHRSQYYFERLAKKPMAN